MASCLAVTPAGGNWSGGGEGWISLNFQGTNGRVLNTKEVSLSDDRYIERERLTRS